MVLTLPMAGMLKEQFPECEIFFMGRSYTKDVIALSKHVDGFINYDDLEKLPAPKATEELKKLKADIFIHVFPKAEIARLAKRSGIPIRVGSTNRIYHWFYCNQWIRLSRKNSDLHEAQLNIKLLSFIGINTHIALDAVKNYYGFEKIPPLNESAISWIDPTRFNLILHPKSKGSAREWGIENFKKLVSLLPAQQYKIFISGTSADASLIGDLLLDPKVTDITGKLSLQQFIAFIYQCDGLIAASTGPLHIAAALRKKAVGLFSPMRPIHPGRWAPVGDHTGFLVFDETCKNCSEGKTCDCIQRIDPQNVIRKLQNV